MTTPAPHRPVLSPCTGVCALDQQGYCLGCFRPGAEIARWIHMGDDERLALMDNVLPQRQAARE